MTATAQRLEGVQEYYFSRKLREVAELIKTGHPIINMGIGSPDLAPPKEVLEALKNGLQHPKAHMYQSYQGIPELREAISHFYKRQYHVSLDAQSEVLPLMGSKERIMHISMAFLNKGDQVLIPNPGYPTYAAVTKLVEAEPVFYNLNAEMKWQPDFKALEALDTSKIKICWLNYPHMPTGTPADLATFDRFVGWAAERNILLVHDNPYSFISNKNPQSLLARGGAKKVVLELNSMSKSFNMAGWRVGMLCGNSEKIQAVLKVKSNMDSGMFYPVQKGAIEALSLEKKWYNDLNLIYSKRKKIVIEICRKLKLNFNENNSGMFIWGKLNDSFKSSEKFVDELLYDKNIFITPGSIFGSNGEGYVRLSLCVDEKKLNEALKRF